MTDDSRARGGGAVDEGRAAEVGRRGLLAGGMALAGAGLGKLLGAERAEAGHNTDIAYDSQTVMHVDVTNTTAGSSRVSTDIAGTAAFVVLNDFPVGISRPDGLLGRTGYTTSNAAGVAGANQNASGGIGVLGTALSATGVGVYGNAGSVVPSEVGPAGTGVFGRGPDRGLLAKAISPGGTGVQGEAITDGVGTQGFATGGGTAVRGDASGGTTSIGVDGRGATNGVVGTASDAAGVGVSGTCAAGTGLRGEADGGTGVLGVAGANGIAGRFAGRALVDGALQVGGSLDAGGAVQVGGPLEAANGLEVTAGALTNLVPGNDGAPRRMYAHAGPEPWLEDFGEATLVRGRATVNIRPDFAALVAASGYQVFLTEYKNTGGLWVSRRSNGSFTVRARRRKAKGKFGYRIVARRADVQVRRGKVKHGGAGRAPDAPQEIEPLPAELLSGPAAPEPARRVKPPRDEVL